MYGLRSAGALIGTGASEFSMARCVVWRQESGLGPSAGTLSQGGVLISGDDCV